MADEQTTQDVTAGQDEYQGYLARFDILGRVLGVDPQSFGSIEDYTQAVVNEQQAFLAGADDAARQGFVQAITENVGPDILADLGYANAENILSDVDKLDEMKIVLDGGYAQFVALQEQALNTDVSAASAEQNVSWMDVGRTMLGALGLTEEKIRGECG